MVYFSPEQWMVVGLIVTVVGYVGYKMDNRLPGKFWFGLIAVGMFLFFYDLILVVTEAECPICANLGWD